MDKLKRLALRLIFPPEWLAAIIVFPAFALLIYVFILGETDTLLAYISYAASAYALLLVCVRIPGIIRAFRTDFNAHPRVRKILDSPRGERFRSDALYRAEISLYAGLAVNLLYTAVKLISGIIFHSLWFCALAGYYLLLSILRYALLHHVRRNPTGQNLLSEWRRYRLCGIVLFVMNQALVTIIVMVVHRNSGFEYPGYLIYVMAGYTFYAVINSVRSGIKFHRHGSPVMSAAKAVNLVAALVSLLSLETAMLTQFGSADNATFRRIMTGATGGAVSVIVLSMAVYMLVRSTKEIQTLK